MIKVNLHNSRERLSILWKLENVHLYHIHLPIRRNKAALFVRELLGFTFHNGNLISATERTMPWTKMAAYFNDLKDEESSVRQTGKLSVRFLDSLNNNQKKWHCSKVNLVMKWERWIKIFSQYIVQTMTALTFEVGCEPQMTRYSFSCILFGFF